MWDQMRSKGLVLKGSPSEAQDTVSLNLLLDTHRLIATIVC